MHVNIHFLNFLSLCSSTLVLQHYTSKLAKRIFPQVSRVPTEKFFAAVKHMPKYFIVSTVTADCELQEDASWLHACHQLLSNQTSKYLYPYRYHQIRAHISQS